MSRAFKIRSFSRWARRTGIDDAALSQAVKEMDAGLIDADLGGHLVKKRMAIQGAGKRGGARVIVATKFGGRWFFVYGFEKNERDNIDTRELRALQVAAASLLALDDAGLKKSITLEEIEEIDHA